MSEYVYDAFISYSHRDLSSARWLQRRLETFRIPRGVAEGERPAGRLRVFRDQTDLAGVELQLALRRELEASRYLIVICSPSSAASHWVNDEIEYFRSLGREDRIIPFIVAGEPESDKPELECFPPALRSEDGRHALGASVPEIGKNKAFLKLMAIVLDLRFNRLVDREKQRRRRTALTVSAAAAAFAGFAAALLLRNAAISRENRELSFDIYGAAIVSLSQKDTLEPEELAFLRTSAEAGNSTAAVMLADCLKNGWGVEANEEEAFSWLMKAAEAGDVEGMSAVAKCYFNGSGVGKDEEQAFLWETRAAEAGSADAMLYLAVDYEEGYGVEPDPAKSFAWYSRAAEAGSELGMYNLARCYLSGYGTGENPEEAFAWMDRLAGLGNTEAMYNLGLMYQYGYGTDVDARAAYLWYRRAAEAGDADGMYMTAWCTENSYGTDDAALEWYRRALESGRTDAAADIERLGG